MFFFLGHIPPGERGDSASRGVEHTMPHTQPSTIWRLTPAPSAQLRCRRRHRRCCCYFVCGALSLAGVSGGFESL